MVDLLYKVGECLACKEAIEEITLRPALLFEGEVVQIDENLLIKNFSRGFGSVFQFQRRRSSLIGFHQRRVAEFLRAVESLQVGSQPVVGIWQIIVLKAASQVEHEAQQTFLNFNLLPRRL